MPYGLNFALKQVQAVAGFKNLPRICFSDYELAPRRGSEDGDRCEQAPGLSLTEMVASG